MVPDLNIAIVGALCLVTAALAIIQGSRRSTVVVVRLAGFAWTRHDFCRGWLISGDTGSGKTRSGINQLLFQVFSNEPNWAAFASMIKAFIGRHSWDMARHFHRENDLILLQVRPDDPPGGMETGSDVQSLYRIAPFLTPLMAKFVVDTAASLGQRSETILFQKPSANSYRLWPGNAGPHRHGCFSR